MSLSVKTKVKCSSIKIEPDDRTFYFFHCIFYVSNCALPSFFKKYNLIWYSVIINSRKTVPSCHCPHPHLSLRCCLAPDAVWQRRWCCLLQLPAGAHCGHAPSTCSPLSGRASGPTGHTGPAPLPRPLPAPAQPPNQETQRNQEAQ